MCPQIALCDRCIVALTAFERSFSRMSFPMSPQITCLDTEICPSRAAAAGGSIRFLPVV